MDRHRYARLTIEGDKKTEWMCGCLLTEDDYFKFCPRHNEYLKRAVLAQIDELDMTVVVAEDAGAGAGAGAGGPPSPSPSPSPAAGRQAAAGDTPQG